MSIISSRSIRHEICIEELRKLDAKVITIKGIMFYVKFNLGDTKLSYAYHLDADNKYYLGRIKPYCMPIGDYQTEEEVVEVIKKDYKQFKNAINSKNFKEFIEVDQKITKLVRNFEDLYLYFNVSKGDLNIISEEVKNILEKIVDVKSRAKKINDGPTTIKN